MKLFLNTTQALPDRTLGTLQIEGVPTIFHTLEDTLRPLGTKLSGTTCIPPGTYAIKSRFSPKFQKITPHLLNVPGFQFILIHSGNNPAHTQGCILVGLGADSKTNTITQSRIACSIILTHLLAAEAQGIPSTITITRPTPAPPAP